MLWKVTSAHEEGGERAYSVQTSRFIADDNGDVAGVEVEEVTLVDGTFVPVAGTTRVLDAQLVLLAMGSPGHNAR